MSNMKSFSRGFPGVTIDSAPVFFKLFAGTFFTFSLSKKGNAAAAGRSIFCPVDLVPGLKDRDREVYAFMIQ